MHRGAAGQGLRVGAPGAAIDRLFRRESGRAVASLIRVLGDFDLAEEAVQEAWIVALERWPRDGVPDNPGAWITTTARNRAIDRLRRERVLEEKRAQLAALEALGGDGERLLRGVLGEVEVAEDADQGGQDAAPLLAEDLIERRYQYTSEGRISTAPP